MDSDGKHRLPPQARWHQIDRLLEQLLGLGEKARARRLSELSAESPSLAARLERLLASARDDSGLEQTLSDVLGCLSGREALPRQRRFGPWRLLEPVGTGGMAQVFRAERADGAYTQEVALKLVWPSLSGEATSRQFVAERQLLANMDDPRIARLLDGGVSEDGRPWLAMEYVDGLPITDYCRHERLDPARRVALFIQVTGAVSAAHRRLAIHGDIKPSNVLVDDRGRVRLLDFGIGRLLGAKAGDLAVAPALTPRFASPEQADRRPITTASDIFQLGTLLQCMLDDADSRPVERIDRDLQALISKATAVEPDKRYTSVDALESDARAWLEHRPLAARGSGRLYRLGRLVRRRRMATGAILVVTAMLIAALGVYHIQAQRIATEAAVSLSVTAFLEDMLHAGDPYAVDVSARIPDQLLEQAVDRVDSELGQQPKVSARILNVLGEVYHSRGEGRRARELFERAGTLAARHGLVEESTRSRAGMAAVGIWSGDYASAEQALRTVLAQQEATHGQEAAVVARTRLQLADLLHSRGLYQAAEEQTLQVLARRHERAWAQRILGMILRDQGRFEEAEASLAQALARERERPDPHRDMLAIVLEHYGQLLLHVGQARNAQAMLDEALSMRRELLGPDWDGLVWTRHWLGLAALAQGQPERAERLLDMTVADYRTAFSEHSHLLAIARSDLGWVQLVLERPARAEALFTSAIRSLEQVQSGDHPRLAEPLMGLALARLALGEPADARRHSARALAIRRNLLAHIDPAHPWIVSACRTHRLAGASCDEEAGPSINGYLDLIRTAALQGSEI